MFCGNIREAFAGDIAAKSRDARKLHQVRYNVNSLNQ